MPSRLVQGMDHVQRGCPCCRRRRQSSIGRCAKSEENTARGINDGTIAMRIETSDHISRCRPLRSIARHQKDGVWHKGAQRLGLLRIRGSDHSPHRRIAAVPTARGTPCFHKLAEVFIKRPAGHGKVLELAR